MRISIVVGYAVIVKEQLAFHTHIISCFLFQILKFSAAFIQVSFQSTDHIELLGDLGMRYWVAEFVFNWLTR